MDRESLEKWLTEQVSYLERMKSEPGKFEWDPDYDYQLAAFRLALERLEPVGPLMLRRVRKIPLQELQVAWPEGGLTWNG